MSENNNMQDDIVENLAEIEHTADIHNADVQNSDATVPAAHAGQLSHSVSSAGKSAAFDYDSMIAETVEALPSARKKLSGILIALGVICLIAAVVLFVFAGQGNRYIQFSSASTYEVPDGMLSGQENDPRTNVVYYYDLDDDDKPYAEERHATLYTTGIFSSQKDLFETGGDEPFDTAYDDNEYDIAQDVVNYRVIELHLPKEATGFVSADKDTPKADDMQDDAVE